MVLKYLGQTRETQEQEHCQEQCSEANSLHDYEEAYKKEILNPLSEVNR